MPQGALVSACRSELSELIFEIIEVLQPVVRKDVMNLHYMSDDQFFFFQSTMISLALFRSGSLMAMKTMLDSGADVNEMVDGRTSLHWAAAMGFKEKLALLLQVGLFISLVTIYSLL